MYNSVFYCACVFTKHANEYISRKTDYLQSGSYVVSNVNMDKNTNLVKIW